MNFKPFIRMFLGKLLFNLDQRNVDKTFDMPYNNLEEKEKCDNYRTRNLGIKAFHKIYRNAQRYGEERVNEVDNRDLYEWNLSTYMYFKIIETKVYRAICDLLNLD